MYRIIEDSYYLIGLHQKDMKEINIYRLNNLLYLLEAYYMCLNNGKELYSQGFNLDIIGLYNKMINEVFDNEHNIILSEAQLRIGKCISKERKEYICTIYNIFGRLSDAKLFGVIHYRNSPVYCAHSNPSVLMMYLKNKTIVSKENTMHWFKDNILKEFIKGV